jgi:hypothetical protein
MCLELKVEKLGKRFLLKNELAVASRWASRSGILRGIEFEEGACEFENEKERN